MFKVRILNSDEIDKWDRFVASHELGTIYHTSLWRRIVERGFGYQPVYLIIEDSNRNISAGLPLFSVNSKITGKRLSSLPCAQCCNPLVSDQEKFDQLINFVLDFKKKCNAKYFELRTSESFQTANRHLGKSLDTYCTYILDIDSPLDVLKRSFHKSCIQRSITKAYKNNLELVVGRSKDDVKIFYRLYLKMRKEHGLLPQPYSFFSTMWEIMSEENRIDILHAKIDDKVISSILLLKYKDTVTYEYGASFSSKLYLRPSHFLLWEAIKRAKLQGYKKFDLGRTSNDNTGLNNFKKRWSGKRQRFRYFFTPDIVGFASERHNKLINDIMCCISRRLPGSLCHLMGTLLYKHFI